MELFHYTCSHGRAALGDVGLVVPLCEHSPDVAARLPEGWEWLIQLSWFTDLARPDDVALGLTRATIACDRTEHRYRATDTSTLVPWREAWRLLPRSAHRLTVGDHRPGHWWLSWGHVPVVYDPFTPLQ